MTAAVSIPMQTISDPTRLSQWALSVVCGTLFTFAFFVVLPALQYRDPVNPEPVIELEFMAWQKLAPVPEAPKIEKPKPIKKPVVKPKPKPKPKPKVKQKPVPPPPAQKSVEPTPMPVPVPEAVQQPEVETSSTETEVITPPPVSNQANADSEAMPTPVPIFQLSKMPRFIRQVEPVYPKTLQLQGISGKVKLSILIDSKGKVREIKILKSKHPEFSKAAIEAINNSSFMPAEINGKSVATRYKTSINFGLR